MTTKVGLYKCRNGKEIQWRVRWFGRYDPTTGKQKRYSKTFDRKVDAESFQKTKDGELDGGGKRDPSQETVKGYAERWLQYRIGFGGIRPATSGAYRETFDRLYGFFGPDRLMRSIDQNEARDFLSSLRPRNESRAEPLTPWTKHRVLRECNCLFGQAATEGVLPSNPFKDSKAPKCPETEWYYVKPEDFHKVLAVTPTLREKVLYALCYTAGLRRNEAISLCWGHIDFGTGEIKIVNRPATDEYPPFLIKDCEARTIPLPKSTVSLLLELQMEAEEGVPFVLLDKRRCGEIQAKWRKCREQGKDWLNRYWVNNTLRDYQHRAKRAGIDSKGLTVTLHDLRKSCIQNWANGLPMNVVKDLAGHSSITTTARFYSTVTEDHRRMAQELGEKLLVGGATDLKLTFSGDSEE